MSGANPPPPYMISWCLLLLKRYNLRKVLARSTTFFQLSLFCATFFQLRADFVMWTGQT
jgi:hypothetical protein